MSPLGTSSRSKRAARLNGTHAHLREATDATFDWFKKYEDVADLIRDAIPDKHARILMLGCGNSTLSEDVRFSPP